MKTVFAALILLGSAAAQATPGQGLAHDQVFWRHSAASTERGDNDRDERRSAAATATSAPEMDPGSAIAAFALLLGGLAIVGGSRSAGKKLA